MATNALVLRGPVNTGWTVFTASAGTEKVYVSNAGSDVTGDGSIGNPYATVAEGVTHLRTGYPDWLLLKCGDTFEEHDIVISKSGASSSERMLVSSYGDGARPVIDSGSYSCFIADFNTATSHLAFVGLEIVASTADGGGEPGTGNPIYGIRYNCDADDILVEDCKISRFGANICFQGHDSTTGRATNLSVRRNVIFDSGIVSNGLGLLAIDFDGILIEENTFYRNGWIDDANADWQARNIYLQNDTSGAVVRGNVIALTDGIQMRSGGTADGNLFIHCTNALQIGGGDNPDAGGVSATVTDNVISDGDDVGVTPFVGEHGPRGVAFLADNIDAATFSGNIITSNVDATAPTIIQVQNVVGDGVTFDSNISYEWGGGSEPQNGSIRIYDGPVVLTDNVFTNTVGTESFIRQFNSTTAAGTTTSSGNRFYSAEAQSDWMRDAVGDFTSFTDWKTAVGDTTSTATQVSFVDATRTLYTYSQSLGLAATAAAFIGECLQQRKGYWRNAFTAAAVNRWIRAGFVEA